MLAGKAVAITGSGGGIGRACALLAGRLGAAVVVNDVRTEAADEVVEEIRQAGGQAVVSHDPIHTWSGATALVSTCVEEFGKIDALVNNAGLGHRTLPWEEREAEMRALVDVNVFGVIFSTRHVIEPMMKQGGGSIINFSSSAAFGLPTRGTYSATKGAVASATFSWAFDLMPYNIRVNAISPHARSRQLSNWAEVSGLLDLGDVRKATAEEVKFSQTLPLAEPEAIAPLVAYLMSDRSQGITGQLLEFTGRRLTVIHRPTDYMAAGAAVERDTWTAENIAEVFDTTLRDDLMPVRDYVGHHPPPSWPVRDRGIAPSAQHHDELATGARTGTPDDESGRSARS